MARYNLWQNENLFAAADRLGISELQKDRGAFFGSIQQTASHVLWADKIWMSRFSKSSAPEGGITESTSFKGSWEDFRIERRGFDQVIIEWADSVLPEWFEGDLSWFSQAIDREISKPRTMLVMQLFNHQTHHRGQIHAMLTSAGVRPGDTDIQYMPKASTY